MSAGRRTPRSVPSHATQYPLGGRSAATYNCRGHLHGRYYVRRDRRFTRGSSIFDGTFDGVDGHHFDGTALWVELQAELLGDGGEDRNVISPCQLEVIAALEPRAIEHSALGVARQTSPDLRHRSGRAMDRPAQHAVRVRVRAATIAFDLARSLRQMDLRPKLPVGAREDERVDRPV